MELKDHDAPRSLEEQLDLGRALRADTSWEDIATLTSTDRDPLAILDEQNQRRLPELLPLRAERMGVSPFTFYRGTAALQAADFARDKNTGIHVASCGDAHVSNFGFYASQQRTLVFDLNDFDEAAWAPWEWDLKRLVASIIIAGRSTNRDEGVTDKAASAAITGYLSTLREAITHKPVEKYYWHFNIQKSRRDMHKESRIVLEQAVADAEKRTGKRAAKKFTVSGDDGQRRFIMQPPRLGPAAPEVTARMSDSLEQYKNSVDFDIQLVLNQYSLKDVAMRVVGVGSVGTRCYVVLFEDGNGNPLILQTKEAGRSVLEHYGRIQQPAQLQSIINNAGEGARVVSMQRILQAFSDPFLGHLQQASRGYYVRQFHDMKGSIEMDTLTDIPFRRYAVACGAVLARAHAQSPNAPEIVGFAGKGKKLTAALMSWSHDYATLSHSDFEAYLGAQKKSD